MSRKCAACVAEVTQSEKPQPKRRQKMGTNHGCIRMDTDSDAWPRKGAKKRKRNSHKFLRSLRTNWTFIVQESAWLAGFGLRRQAQCIRGCHRSPKARSSDFSDDPKPLNLDNSHSILSLISTAALARWTIIGDSTKRFNALSLRPQAVETANDASSACSTGLKPRC